MKRIICILLIAMISMPVILGVQAQGIDVDKKESEVVPSYVGLHSMSPALGISSMLLEKVVEAQKGSEAAKLELKKSLQGEFF